MINLTLAEVCDLAIRIVVFIDIEKYQALRQFAEHAIYTEAHFLSSDFEPLRN